jgi:hypothetical protein
MRVARHLLHDRSVRSLSILFAWVLLGCGARTELDVPGDAAPDAKKIHDAAHDVADDVVDAGPDVIIMSPFCTPSDVGKPEKTCMMHGKVGTIVTQSGCYVDVVVHEYDTGTIEYACDGVSTWASASFNGTTFAGAVTNGTFVDICIGTVYPWEDGPACGYKKSTWASAQRIYGDVATGDVSFVYDEKQISGMSCDIACTAVGDIALQ